MAANFSVYKLMLELLLAINQKQITYKFAKG